MIDHSMATQFMSPYAYMGAPPSVGYNGYPNGRNGGFSFRKRVERVDWRKIASVDIDHISRTLDFTTLQDNVMNITFCNLEAELDIRSIDPNFVKLFKLAQLTIEYLLHSQEYLAGLCASLEEKAKLSDQEVEKIKMEVTSLQKELTEVKKESHKRKKLLIAQQQLMYAGNESYNKCPFCAKAFLNTTFLQAHITRRHSGAITAKDGSSSVSPDLGVGSESGRNHLEAELSQIKEQMQRQQAEIEAERKALLSLKNKDSRILATEIKQNIAVHSDLGQEEGEAGISVALMREIKELNAKLQASQKALVELETRTGGKRSYLGELVDDNEIDKQEVKEQKLEIAVMKEQLQHQLDQMKEHMQTKLERQGKKWQKKMHRMAQQHVSETKKLNNALETTTRSQDGLPPSPRAASNQQKEVERLLKQSREREKALEVEVQQIEQEIVQASEVKPLRTPPLSKSPRSNINQQTNKPTNQQTNVIQSRPIKPSSMYPSDEEESTAFGTGTSSLRTIGGSTLGQTGTQTLHTSQFLEEFRKNPTLALMREQLAELLQEHVEKKGIPPNQTGITDQVLESKLNMLRTQRYVNIQKYPNFLELRDHFNRKATEEARRQLKMQMSSPRGQLSSELSPHSTRQNRPASSGPRAGPPHPQQNLSAQRTTPRSSSGPPSVPTTKPQPQPRAASALSGRTPLSTGSTTEWTSTQFDSDDESAEDNPPSVGGKAFIAAPGVRLIQSGPAQVPSPSPRTQGPKARLIQSRPMNNNADDEIDDILESDRQDRNSAAQERGTGGVSSLRKNIESQLGARSPNSKPFGGVDTMGSGGGKKPNVGDDFDEESDWDSTAPEDPLPAAQRRPPARVSTDGMSTNTYGSSAWGSTSKAASTVKDKDRRSTSRSSHYSITSVSSDEEMNVDNI
ncbi:unnamed protein product [Lymnaea stagnalis]|uniref:C2H2-type domain-containing protein n=1 Tax=Lymnaea stagnalis TaxID=6523 RepID=A0AAV2HII7_LYMST